MHSAISRDEIDDLTDCSRPGGGIKVDQELTNGDYEQFPLAMYGFIFDKLEDLILPNSDPDSIVDMLDNGQVHFDPLAFSLREPDDLQGTSIINLDRLVSSEFDTNKSSLKEN